MSIHVKEVYRFKQNNNMGLTDEQKKKASQAFDDLDAEGTGTIPNTKSTLMQGVQLTGQNPTSQDLDTCMSSVADKGGTLDKDEFLQFVEGFDWKTEDTIKNELRKDFECFDKDKSGFLDQSELKDILTKYGVENLTDEEVAEFLDAIDKNSDGRINLDELAEFLASTVYT